MNHRKHKPRKGNTTTVGDAIDKMLNNFNIKGKFDEASLVASWERLMGKTIASQTKKLYIRDHVLFVEIKSAPLKHELNMSKEKMLAILRKDYGEGVVRGIVIM